MIKTLIYCASGYCEKVAYSLDDTVYQVVGLVDRNPELWGKTLHGLGKVIAPSEIKQFDFDLIIIAVSKYEEEIRNGLVNKYGVDEDRIVTYCPQVHNIKWKEERIVMLRKCISMIKERNVPGDMAEVGVYQGEFAKYFNRYFPEKKLYLFDTFEGFDTEKDIIPDRFRNLHKDTSIELVLSKMMNPNNCIVRKGYFPDTASDISASFSLVSLDTDFYNPILAGLEFFYPRLVKGGYIFVHDFGEPLLPEVKKAVYHYCEKQDISIVPIVDAGLSAIITK